MAQGRLLYHLWLCIWAALASALGVGIGRLFMLAQLAVFRYRFTPAAYASIRRVLCHVGRGWTFVQGLVIGWGPAAVFVGKHPSVPPDAPPPVAA